MEAETAERRTKRKLSFVVDSSGDEGEDGAEVTAQKRSMESPSKLKRCAETGCAAAEASGVTTVQICVHTGTRQSQLCTSSSRNMPKTPALA